MNRIRFISLCILIVLCNIVTLVAEEIVDGIAVIVGDKAVLRSEWNQTAYGMAIQSGLNPSEDIAGFEKLKMDILRNLIHNKIIYIKAEEDTITVDHEIVEKELNNRIEGLIQQLGSTTQLENSFGMPISQIRRDNRETIQEQLTVQKVQQEKLATIEVTRRDVESFFDAYKDSLPAREASVRLRHLLLEIKAGSGTRKKALAKIESIRNQLLEGEPFESLATQYSEDPSTSKNGGLLGFVEKGMLFETFDEAAFALSPGEISDIVETPVGLHLIKCEERQEEKSSLRHILIRMEMTENDEVEVKKMIYDFRARILEGEDFSELARTYSDDPSSKDQGGDLGWLPLNYLQIEAFQQAAVTLEVNEISQPFLTQFGYHLIRLEDKREAGVYSLRDDWEQIKGMALNQKQQRLMNEMIDELKKDIYIWVADDIGLDLSTL